MVGGVCSNAYLECPKVCGGWASALCPKLLLEEGARRGAVTKTVWHLMNVVCVCVCIVFFIVNNFSDEKWFHKRNKTPSASQYQIFYSVPISSPRNSVLRFLLSFMKVLPHSFLTQAKPRCQLHSFRDQTKLVCPPPKHDSVNAAATLNI